MARAFNPDPEIVTAVKIVHLEDEWDWSDIVRRVLQDENVAATPYPYRRGTHAEVVEQVQKDFNGPVIFIFDLRIENPDEYYDAQRSSEQNPSRYDVDEGEAFTWLEQHAQDLIEQGHHIFVLSAKLPPDAAARLAKVSIDPDHIFIKDSFVDDEVDRFVRLIRVAVNEIETRDLRDATNTPAAMEPSPEASGTVDAITEMAYCWLDMRLLNQDDPFEYREYDVYNVTTARAYKIALRLESSWEMPYHLQGEELTVHVHCIDARIERPTQVMHIPERGDMTQIDFEVVFGPPETGTQGQTAKHAEAEDIRKIAAIVYQQDYILSRLENEVRVRSDEP